MHMHFVCELKRAKQWSDAAEPSSAMFERVDKIGTEVSHVENIARRERHGMDLGGSSEERIHG